MRSLVSHCFVLLIVYAASSAEAFASVRPVQRNLLSIISHDRTLCFLHPSQAEDLEACAYDLMKATLESEARQQEQAARNNLSQDILKKLSTEARGPMSWARRKLWPSKDVVGAGAGMKMP
jgi:hypothetical protein